MSDMVCENCGSTDAVVHLTQTVDNEMSTHHLCAKCGGGRGLAHQGRGVGVGLVHVCGGGLGVCWTTGGNRTPRPYGPPCVVVCVCQSIMETLHASMN